jgi:VWFA-related protein
MPRKLFSICVLFVSAVGLALAQQQAPPTPAQTAPPASAQTEPPQSQTTDPQAIFRSRADLITTDVIVRNADGQFVADLEKGDFQVLEDDVPQKIVSMVLVHGGRTLNKELPPPPPTAEGIILPPTRPTNDAAGRIFLIFVDDLHLDFKNTGRIRDLFKKISNTLIHDGDMFGIVSTGPSSIAIDLTYDRKRLDEALNKIAGNALKPSDILDTAGQEGSEGPPEVRYRAHTAFSTAYDIMKKLEAVHNRRKAFIYVSNGYDFNPFPASRAAAQADRMGTFQQSQSGAENYTDPFQAEGNRFAEADLARELTELTRAANRANTTIYTIDPRGLVGMPDLDEKVDQTDWADYVRTSQDSLRVIAQETGGIAVVNQNDFDKALKRIDAETSDYYVLGYYSSNSDPTKRTRKIDVKVTRPGMSVWSRHYYSMKPNPRTSASQ